MRAAGVTELGGPVRALDLPDPLGPTTDGVLIEVFAAGVANWDEIVRAGGWDVGASPPMALGVAAAGVVRPRPAGAGGGAAGVPGPGRAAGPGADLRSAGAVSPDPSSGGRSKIRVQWPRDMA